MSLYTEEVQRILKQKLHDGQCPRGLRYSVIDEDFPAPSLKFILFRDNFETFDGVDKERIAKLVGDTIMTVRNTGIPMFLDVYPGSGLEEERTD